MQNGRNIDTITTHYSGVCYEHEVDRCIAMKRVFKLSKMQEIFNHINFLSTNPWSAISSKFQGFKPLNPKPQTKNPKPQSLKP